MPSIIYGMPTWEADPEIKTVNTWSGEETIYSGITLSLVRKITTFEGNQNAIINAASRLTMYDELVVKGVSYGGGWTIYKSDSRAADSGFVEITIQYRKYNISPFDWARPAAMGIRYAEDSATVFWHGADAVTWTAEGAMRGFRFVDGEWTAKTATAKRWKASVNGGVGPFRLDYVLGSRKFPARSIVLGDDTPVVTQYGRPRESLFPPIPPDHSPVWEDDPVDEEHWVYSRAPGNYATGWNGQEFDTALEAVDYGDAKYFTEWEPLVAAAATEMQGIMDGGGVLREGFTSYYSPSSSLSPLRNYGFVTVGLNGAGKYTVGFRTPVGGVVSDFEDIWLPTVLYWDVDEEEDVARLKEAATIGKVLLTIPPEESDSSSSGSGA